MSKNITINYFKRYDLFKMLNWSLVQYRILNKFSYRNYLSLIKRFIFKTDEIVYNRNAVDSPILYFDHMVVYRKDIQEMKEHLMGIIGCDYDTIAWRKSYHFSLKRTIKMLHLLYSWKNDIRKIDFNNKEKIVVYCILLDFVDILDNLEQLKIKKYKLTLCFYDAEPYQNLLSQYLKILGCTTATLQHGVMLAPRPAVPNNIDFSGIEFASFVCDYYLVWNEFTKSEAIKAGIEENRIVVLGVCKCLGISQLGCDKNSSTIGIFLDGEYEKYNNPILISIVQNWARQNGKRCMFRLHPNFKGDEYNDLFDFDVSDVCSKGMTLQDFIHKCSFLILANSTVLFELEYFCIPFLRYSCGDERDKFKDYPSFSFTTLDDFDQAYHKMNKALSRNFESCDQAYRDFFKKFCSEYDKDNN